MQDIKIKAKQPRCMATGKMYVVGNFGRKWSKSWLKQFGGFDVAVAVSSLVERTTSK